MCFADLLMKMLFSFKITFSFACNSEVDKQQERNLKKFKTAQYKEKMCRRLGYKLRNLRKTYVGYNLIMILSTCNFLSSLSHSFVVVVSTTVLLKKHRGTPVADNMGSKT